MKTAEEILQPRSFMALSGEEMEQVVSVEDAIEAMKIYGEQFKPKWISVEERQPDQEGICLTLRTSKRSGLFMITAHHEGKSYPINLTGWHDVTHWMPLPEPPNHA